MSMERLAYKNRFVKRVVQDLSNYEASEMTPQIISGDNNLILLNVTLDEWKKLLSSVFTGADICYPDESDSVRWILLRAVEQPMDACAWLTNLLETCPDVQDSIFGLMQYAIQNVPSVQDAFEGWFLSDETLRETLDHRYSVPTIPTELAKKSILKPLTCGEGFIFNQATALVDMLNTLSEDLFEAIEVGTNALERWGIATSAIPAFGQIIPVDEGLAFVNQLIEELQEEYSGAYDLGMRNDLRCEIFCLAKNDCSLSLEQVIAFYEGKVTGLSLEDPITLLQEIIAFINTGDYPGDLPVYIMHLLVLALIRAAGDVFGIDFANMYLEIIAAGDTENNDWEILCAECAPDFDLQAVIGFPDALQFVGTEGVNKVYEWTSIYTGNYATGSLESVGDVPFKVSSIEMISGTFNAGAVLNVNGTNYTSLETFPLDTPMTGIGMYNLNAGSVIRLKAYV